MSSLNTIMFFYNIHKKHEINYLQEKYKLTLEESLEAVKIFPLKEYYIITSLETSGGYYDQKEMNDFFYINWLNYKKNQHYSYAKDNYFCTWYKEILMYLKKYFYFNNKEICVIIKNSYFSRIINKDRSGELIYSRPSHWWAKAIYFEYYLKKKKKKSFLDYVRIVKFYFMDL